eukprot:6298964-Amphidinium_carterae.1
MGSEKATPSMMKRVVLRSVHGSFRALASAKRPTSSHLVRGGLDAIELVPEASIDRSLVVPQGRLRLSPLASQE